MVQIRTLCVLTCFLAISQISADSGFEEKCTYMDCFYYGVIPRHSLIEKCLLSLKFSKLPHEDMCSKLRERIATCDPERSNCPNKLQQPYEQRMHDYIYVDFLTQVSSYCCRNQPIVEQLRDCFNDELESCLQTCFQQNLKFDRKCVLLEFYKHARCPPYAVDVFINLIDNYLMYNPYWKVAVPAPKESLRKFWPDAFLVHG